MEKIVKRIRKMDRFGSSIQLRFDQHAKNKTLFGGFFTIFVYFVVIYFFFIEIIELIINRQPILLTT
jgi:hypothetical protein